VRGSDPQQDAMINARASIGLQLWQEDAA